jgi:hypothetical protein
MLKGPSTKVCALLWGFNRNNLSKNTSLVTFC